MKPVSKAITDRFTSRFCYGRNGYSLRQLEDLFTGYQVDVPSVDPSMPPTKNAYFHECVYSMTPENQRQFLYDLCDAPPAAAGPLPSEDERKKLLALLAQADGVSPIGLEFSCLTLRGVRNQWFTASSRLTSSPSSAITAARVLLETTCKTILEERNETADSSGDLSRLYKQTRQTLGLDTTSATPQSVHQILNGLTQTVNGLAAISNLGGDRHGLRGGKRITEHSLAGLAVHASGVVSLFLVRIHRTSMRAAVGPV